MIQSAATRAYWGVMSVAFLVASVGCGDGKGNAGIDNDPLSAALLAEVARDYCVADALIGDVNTLVDRNAEALDDTKQSLPSLQQRLELARRETDRLCCTRTDSVWQAANDRVDAALGRLNRAQGDVSGLESERSAFEELLEYATIRRDAAAYLDSAARAESVSDSLRYTNLSEAMEARALARLRTNPGLDVAYADLVARVHADGTHSCNSTDPSP